jgi:hypothetical protein
MPTALMQAILWLVIEQTAAELQVFVVANSWGLSGVK